MTFEYANPEAILADLLPTLKSNEIGHTALEDFANFCSVTGCPKDDKWAKLAFVWEWTQKQEVEARAAKAAELIGKAVGKMTPGGAD
ncbi:hypothetical protein BZM27_06210 [Paraburkholderia steynii]|uniref:Uncharacterized protein n=1 Tax=Paraburkholderia steynii TaxID=1245441 RepID=A0A4R0XRR8_9BURK|nr:hypothetical protein BZM27_06210 [Paraburkholderia steynii]